MEILFKVITTPAPSVPTVGDTNFGQHYAGVNNNMAWEELTPAIRQATEKFVLDYVGTELYDDLAAKYIAGTSLTTQQSETIRKLQDAIAYYAVYHILPEKNTVLASLGVVQQSPEGGSTPTNQWSWRAKRDSALQNGDFFLDRALAYMEKQVKAAVSYFDLWKNSAAYKVRTSDFFRSTSDLDEFVNIQQSRRSYISFVRFLKQVEEEEIQTLLCTDLYPLLLVASPTTANAKLIPMVKKAVAYLGAAKAIPHHRIVIDGDGFRVVSFTDQFEDRRNQTNSIHSDAIEALQKTMENTGQKALKELRKFLEDNITDYPLYANSTCRELPPNRGHSIVQSEDGIGVVGLF